jgi:hypothetical protein
LIRVKSFEDETVVHTSVTTALASIEKCLCVGGRDRKRVRAPRLSCRSAPFISWWRPPRHLRASWERRQRRKQSVQRQLVRHSREGERKRFAKRTQWKRAPEENRRSLRLERCAAHLADNAWSVRSMAESDTDQWIKSRLLRRNFRGASLGFATTARLSSILGLMRQGGGRSTKATRIPHRFTAGYSATPELSRRRTSA